MPPLFDTTKMSSDEFRFIRAYCAAVRQDYYAISAAIALTDPAELNLVCPFTTAKLAIGLQGLYRECAHKLAEVGARHLNKPAKDCLPTINPSIEAVGQIFTLSFFKILDSKTKSVISTPANKTPHDGWSSGRPEDWQHSIKSLHSIQTQTSGPNSGAVFSKLFSMFISYTVSSSSAADYDDYDYDDDEDDYYFDTDNYFN